MTTQSAKATCINGCVVTLYVSTHGVMGSGAEYCNECGKPVILITTSVEVGV